MQVNLLTCLLENNKLQGLLPAGYLEMKMFCTTIVERCSFVLGCELREESSLAVHVVNEYSHNDLWEVN